MSAEVEVDLVPIRGRTTSLEHPGKVHWGVVWPDSDRDGRLWSLCCEAENRIPVYGQRIHPRFEVECKHCLQIVQAMERGLSTTRWSQPRMLD